jgi:hypothetical protein
MDWLRLIPKIEKEYIGSQVQSEAKFFFPSRWLRFCDLCMAKPNNNTLNFNFQRM